VGGGCIKEPVTTAHYRRHLAGSGSLGIYPLRQDGRCRWFAIDIDEENLGSAIAAVEKLHELGFNRGVYLERSKSKGYHVFGFTSDWVPAKDLRYIARQAILQAGLRHSTEIFPKQDVADAIRFGNYLNLPYFGGHNPDGRRMMLDIETLGPVPLSRWLEVAETFPADALALVLSALPRQEDTPQRRDPQGIVNLLSQPLAVGERRPTLVKAAGYLRCRGIPEDVAVSLLLPWAAAKFVGLLPPEEVEKHIRGIYRRYGTRTLDVQEEEMLREIPEHLQEAIQEIWR
jgi:hypothetical protein